MLLKDLLQNVNYKILQGNLEQLVDEVIYDSRIKTDKGLFIAVKGFDKDGHEFIDSAINNGAKTIVLEDEMTLPDTITVVQVKDTRQVMAQIATNRYQNPSEAFNIVGVTGTNGKTSITYLLGCILETYERKIGIIGTIENRIGETILQAQRTTPEALELQKLFAKMRDEQVTECLMEVSSHALDLYRVKGTTFKVGIFTNLTQDHLDFHKTMENYARAKAKLFRQCEIGIINVDSEYSTVMLENHTCKVVTYGIDCQADYKASNIEICATGVTYQLQTPEGSYEIKIPIPGKFTVYNTMAVIATARSLNIPMKVIIEALKQVKGVPGRVQGISSIKGYSVLVDYAHTPDGLENVLETIKQFAKGRIITVFGCGGDRDNTKRPIMGEIAAKYSDEVMITSDNPRSENPAKILNQIEEGVKKYTTPYQKIEDRKEAIHHALTKANCEDVILVAGKGHENYQILADRIIHFDDMEVVKAFMQEEKTCN